jgi:hypothetical protein
LLKTYGVSFRLRPYQKFKDTEEELWSVICQEIAYPSGPVGKRLGKVVEVFTTRMKTFLHGALSAGNSAGNVCATISLRRSRGTNTQHLFNTLHHHFTTVDLSRRILVKLLRIRSGIIHNARAGALTCRQMMPRIFWNTLHSMDDDWEHMMRIYHDSFLPTFIRHLELMSPSEIQRRSAAVPKYWLRYWQKQRENDKRSEYLETQRQAIRNKRNEQHGIAMLGFKRLRIGERVDPANEPPPYETRKHTRESRSRKKHR